jgi:hypothetical protein
LAAQVVGTERVELMAEEVRNHLPELGGVGKPNWGMGRGGTGRGRGGGEAGGVGGWARGGARAEGGGGGVLVAEKAAVSLAAAGALAAVGGTQMVVRCSIQRSRGIYRSDPRYIFVPTEFLGLHSNLGRMVEAVVMGVMGVGKEANLRCQD